MFNFNSTTFMKNFFKFCFVALLMLISFSCQEGTDNIFSTENKHSNERTNASITISTPWSPTSSVTYDDINIVNGGSIHINSGVTINATHVNDNTTSGNPAINVYYGGQLIAQRMILQNAHVENDGYVSIYNLTSNGSGVSFKNFTTLRINSSMIWNAGQFYNYNLIDAWDYSPLSVNPKVEINGGNLNFNFCSLLKAQSYTQSAANAVTGQGRFEINNIFNLVAQLTTSSQIKYCGAAPFGAGGVGNAYASCTTTCP